jgi:dipeptidyl aminopeptidase/acylaminoacyl peptidase
MKYLLRCSIAVLSLSSIANAQTALAPLTVEKIMRDPKWMGTQPSGHYWSADGKQLFFSWNPEGAISDSLYAITTVNTTPRKLSFAEKQALQAQSNPVFNQAGTAYVSSANGDVFYTDLKTGITRRITQTEDAETNPQFSFAEKKIVYSRNQNLYAWDIATGETLQLTRINRGEAGAPGAAPGGRAGFGAGSGSSERLNPQEQWLKNDQLAWIQILKERKDKNDAADKYRKAFNAPNEQREIKLDGKNLGGMGISPDGRFVSYRLSRQAGGKQTIVPSYVTESGFTTDINGRTKVGAPPAATEAYLYDRQKDTILAIITDSLPGIKDVLAYVKDYPKQWEERNKKPASRAVTILGPYWNASGSQAVVDVRSIDNKDRWLALVNLQNGKLQLLDRQHDDAWIAGPGIGGGFGGGQMGWIDDNNFWFKSEATGYSHVYAVDVRNQNKRAITSGNYEVLTAQLNKAKTHFYLTTNEVEPGQQQFYKLPVAGGKAERLTNLVGANEVEVSPDEKWLAIRYSYSNKPWELYLQENKPGATPKQITNQAMSAEFKSYAWRDPEVVTIKAADGANVYARLYKPANPHPTKPAVIFVHGAGYLQNAHKWWSSYFREYMFHNLLVDMGYTVLDIDYRGSAGYGRDWRTGIYRHMGGKDLSDHVDAAKWLVQQHGVDANRIGIYGGSYGGFITLMGMFTTPGVFKAGAALRPVTDWAHYNHGYTANILNEPVNDSIAYRRSSPIYFAEGLKDRLLICHGLIDVNVHVQDVMRLNQRLIELGKNNFEIALYPLEDHGFVEPSSWTDEYKRILKLFEEELKK